LGSSVLPPVFAPSFLLIGMSRARPILRGVLSVACLLLKRLFPNKVFDDKVLRERVGDRPVNRLNTYQNVALALLMLGLVIGLALAPVLRTAPRHVFAGLALGGIGSALIIYAYVEISYRSLLVRAGLLAPARRPG
jgi:hypothetical protein